MHKIDNTIKAAISKFTEYVFSTSWKGKEREAVSLFAFGFLLQQCFPEGVLYDPAQIGIEVRVPKAPTLGIKREICKDLVIWSSPCATCWSEGEQPVAILEWKVNFPRIFPGDVEWLIDFSTGRPDFIGYAITLDLENRNFRLSCTRVRNRKACPEWLIL